MPEVEKELAARLEADEEVVLATVIRLDGAPPSRPGAKALFDPDRQLAGTLGCAEFDSEARADAPGLLRDGAPELRTYRHDLGSIEVYLEPYPRRPRLLVLGDTPVAAALRTSGRDLGFEVLTQLDWTTAGRGDLYVVHTDHDDPKLVQALLEVFALGPRFVGLMGSRRHTGHHLEALRGRGLADAEIDRIQTPVGLDIGAQTPAEIALSILAGLVAVRRGAAGGWKDTPPGA